MTVVPSLLSLFKGIYTSSDKAWIMRQAGRHLAEYQEIKKKHTFLELVHTPELAANVTLMPIKRYGDLLDAAIVFSDIMIVPEALGIEFDYVEGTGIKIKTLVTPVFLSASAVPFDYIDRISFVLETIKIVRARLEPGVSLIGFCGGPLTLLSFIIGKQNIAVWLYKYPQACHRFLDVLAEACATLLFNQLLVGADVLQVFESGVPDLKLSLLEDFCFFYLKKIYNKVTEMCREVGETCHIILYIRGMHYAIKNALLCNYNGLSVDWNVTPKYLKQCINELLEETDFTLRPNFVVQGNLDPAVLLASRHTLSQELKLCVEGFRSFGFSNYVFNLGHGIKPDTQSSAVEYLLKCLKDRK